MFFVFDVILITNFYLVILINTFTIIINTDYTDISETMCVDVMCSIFDFVYFMFEFVFLTVP